MKKITQKEAMNQIGLTKKKKAKLTKKFGFDMFGTNKKNKVSK